MGGRGACLPPLAGERGPKADSPRRHDGHYERQEELNRSVFLRLLLLRQLLSDEVSTLLLFFNADYPDGNPIPSGDDYGYVQKQQKERDGPLLSVS